MSITAMKQALEALVQTKGVLRANIANLNRIDSPNPYFFADIDSAITALRTAIEEEENKSLAEKPVLYTEVESEYWIAEDGSLL